MKILICDKLDEESLNKIRDAGLDVTYRAGMSPEELIATVPGYGVMVVRRSTHVTREVIDTATDLKLIVRAGVGLDNVDVKHAKERGVEVINTPGAATVSVAEHTIGLMISLARNIPQGYSSTREGRWERKKYTGSELMGKTLGLIGFGRIGQETAARARAFGMKVIAYDPILEPEIAGRLDTPLMGFDELLARSDYISLHIPLAPETKYIINAETIAGMKKGVRIINCARGGLVDEKALAEAIESGHVAGAAFDVFENEPPGPANPLLALENFICVPHLGAYTAEGQARVGAEVARIVIEFVRHDYGRRASCFPAS